MTSYTWRLNAVPETTMSAGVLLLLINVQEEGERNVVAGEKKRDSRNT